MKLVRLMLWLTILIITALGVTCLDVYGVSTLNGFSSGSIPVLHGSANDLKCSGKLQISNYLVNKGDVVDIKLLEKEVSKSFAGRSSSHNRSATYKYDGVYYSMIRVGQENFETSNMNYTFYKPGDYQIQGIMTFRWATGIGKRSEGFPAYYYKTVLVGSKTVRVTSLDEILKPPEENNDEEQEKITPILNGKVMHTEQWENNRIMFNKQCRSQGKMQYYREEDEYWSGEKFILEADAIGEKLPSTVSVTIEGTDYTTILRKEGSVWSGSLFDKSMIGMWGSLEKEDLIFVFSASIDGSKVTDSVSITIDDIVKYWIMHRKE